MTKGDHPKNPDVDLASGAFWGRNPHDELAWLRANAPVYWDEQSKVWGISRYADVKAVSKNPEVFSSAGGIRPGVAALPMMIDMDDPDHWRRRRLVNSGFTPKQVRAQTEKITRVVDELIDQVCESGECDFIWDLAAWLPLVMIGDALGVAPEDRPTLLKWSDDMMNALVGLDNELAAVRAGEAFTGYSEYATRVIDNRRTCPRDDLMSVLVGAEWEDGSRLDHDALVHESLLILIGGDETTRHVISGGAYQLMIHPEQRQALIDDPSKIPTAVEEMLRWVSPIKNMARTATCDTELGGQHIEAGDELLLLYSSANRDEEIFDDPFTFDIARDPNEHVAFGFGTHFCLGNSLARLELRVFFERLLARLPDMSLRDDAEPPYRPANFVSGYESMPVTFSPAKPMRT